MNIAFRKILICLIAVFALSAMAATDAQAAVKGGPIWITKAGELKATETRNIAKVEAKTPQKLSSPALKVECTSLGVKAGSVNTINGGNPGTDHATLVFDHCHVEGKSTCGVSGGGAPVTEIWVPVQTLLGYEVGKTEALPIYDQFFATGAESKVGGKTVTLFVALTVENVTACGVLKGKVFNVYANGSTAPKPVGFGTHQCGVIAEVGKYNTSMVFELAISGELFKLGGLRVPTTAITQEDVWNSEANGGKGEFQLVKCGLQVGEEAATQSGSASIELEHSEEFGVEV